MVDCEDQPTFERDEDFEKEKINIPLEIKKLAEERESARKNKDWKKADEIRNKINTLGYSINDTPNGIEIKIK